MNFVPYAVPVFIALILLELCWGWIKGNNTYRVNDSINSLSLGMVSQTSKLIFLNIGYLVFVQIGQDYSFGFFDSQRISHWIIGLLLYDLLYYLSHRISHERQFFWASHVVHHQSEDFNLSTALRQTSTSFIATWLFYIPCFLLGMPISMFVSIASAQLIYQFWVHSEHIPKLGAIEWLFVTPSNHRVHHAQNADYVDKNYGGLLIIWDRLFGTFKEENPDQPAMYGIRTPLKSFNPLWANLHIYVDMLRDAWHTKSWRDKAKVLWARTGWRPEDSALKYPQIKTDLVHIEKYNPQLSRISNLLVVVQYLMVAAIHFWTSLQAVTGPYGLILGASLVQIASLMIIGAVLDGRSYARALETLRCVAVILILYLGFNTGLINHTGLSIGILYALVSASLMQAIIRRENSSTATAMAG
ncbi:MAG: sterol desaturase family protein [Porticoccaceae bacterium]|nr:sterol desaturase family protein [Porticoccaceae bacterium]